MHWLKDEFKNEIRDEVLSGYRLKIDALSRRLGCANPWKQERLIDLSLYQYLSLESLYGRAPIADMRGEGCDYRVRLVKG